MNWNNWLYADRLGEEEQTIKPHTNADRIRAMTDEELAGFLGSQFSCLCCPAGKHCAEFRTVGCYGSMMVWLQQPAEGD